MPALEDRVEALERRVSEWEGQLGFFVPLVRQLHREILSTREDVQRLENRVERLEEKVDRGFASMSEKFREVDERFLKLESTLEALPRALAEEIARRRS
jgi:predicted  nucleic acid-binding Zn-ribbon protein